MLFRRGINGPKYFMVGTNCISYSYYGGNPKVCPLGKEISLSTMTFPEFILGNCIFMAYVLISVFLATFYPGEWALVLGLSTAAWIFSNFLIHAYYTLSSGEYSPGVVTAGAVYVPVSLYIYTNFWGSGILTPLDIYGPLSLVLQ